MMWLAMAGLLALGGAADGQPAPGAWDPGETEPQATYWVYVGSESADFLHRIRFGPDGAHREADISMAELYRQSQRGDLFTESEAPHGVAVDPQGGSIYMTTGHGVPDGKLWQVEAGSGRLLADPVDLGRFPASLGVSPDGNYVYVANFNLHGRMVPSSISVIYGPEMVEVARVETCTMPHGSRVHPNGLRHYSTCMMDDQLVEIDAMDLAVSRRFFLGTGQEGPLDPGDRGFHAPGADHGEDHGHAGHPTPDPAPGEDVHAHHAPDPEHRDRDPTEMDAAHPVPDSPHYEASCSPTWVQPSQDGARLYVACNASDRVLEIDYEAWEVRRTFETGRGPYNVDVTPDDRLLVVTLKQGDGVEVIDLVEGELRGQVETSTRVVHGIALSPDSRYAFISVEGIGAEPGKVDIIDLETVERVASVEVGQQASGIAFWRMEGGL